MRTTLLALSLIAISCKTAMPVTESSADPARNTLAELLNANPAMQPYLQNKDSLRIQVIYTRIDRDGKNNPHFTDYTFNVDPDKYFYPASTVKMPIAFLALEKLNHLKEKGIDRNTTMITDSSFSGQQVVYTQPLSQDSKGSIAHYIRQIFLVSDNEASNRLYEFLGQEYIYDQLKKKGFDHSVIRHRLAVFLSPEQNRHTNPVSFCDTSGAPVYEQPAQYSNALFPSFDTKLGKGYYSGDKPVNEPFDFSLKNHVSLPDLHNVLRSMIFPRAVKKEQQFDISDDDRQFALRWMSSYPRESKYPSYDTTEYPDTYAKFLGRNILPDPSIRIFSKSGWAYGFLTDVAYVIDLENNIEFMLSATILCNKDEIFNDDKYDFDTIGYPFMKTLGQIVYQYELKRERKHKPDLSSFRFSYPAD
jgi:hypothetical protein